MFGIYFQFAPWVWFWMGSAWFWMWENVAIGVVVDQVIPGLCDLLGTAGIVWFQWGSPENPTGIPKTTALQPPYDRPTTALNHTLRITKPWTILSNPTILSHAKMAKWNYGWNVFGFLLGAVWCPFEYSRGKSKLLSMTNAIQVVAKAGWF